MTSGSTSARAAGLDMKNSDMTTPAATSAASANPTTDWSAPLADRPVVGAFSVPGSKSLTNRYLVLAALADDDSLLRAPLRSRDTLLMAQALRSVGVQVEDVPGDSPEGDDWHVTPAPFRGPAQVDCGLAGTVMRFLPPVAALADGPVAFDGDEHARNRPMGPVLQALADLGVRIDDDGRRALPFTVHGTGAVTGGRVEVDASTSSQFVSALLLSGARFDEGVTIVHTGATLPSIPHIDMTVEVLRDAGVVIEVGDDVDADGRGSYAWSVEPSDIRALDVMVEPDLSNAAPFLAAAAVTGGEVFMADWPTFTTQPGDHIRGVLERIGCKVTLDRDGLRVRGPESGRLRGIDVDLTEASELTPVVVALCALADGGSRIRGVAHIRGHETDRLAALSREFTAIGAQVHETEDGLVITPVPREVLHGGLFHTYDDHRMAMAAAVVGLVVDGIVVENVGTTAKTLPHFDRRWEALLDGTSAAHEPALQRTV